MYEIKIVNQVVGSIGARANIGIEKEKKSILFNWSVASLKERT